jgi:hypothetical protein
MQHKLDMEIESLTEFSQYQRQLRKKTRVDVKREMACEVEEHSTLTMTPVRTLLLLTEKKKRDQKRISFRDSKAPEAAESDVLFQTRKARKL